MQTMERYSSHSSNSSRELIIASESQNQVVFKMDTRDLDFDGSEYQLEVSILIGTKRVDRAMRKSLIKPNGYEFDLNKGGQLSIKKPAVWDIKLPETRISRPVFTMRVYSK